MSLAAAPALEVAQRRADGRAYIKARFSTALDWAVAFWIFSGSVVVTEPSPYELSFFLVLGATLLAGSFTFHRSTLGLIVLWGALIPFAVIAAFQPKYSTVPAALQFQVVTIFLLFTAYWVANYVADAPQKHMRIIVNAYILTAVFSAMLGTAGYLGLIPHGHDLLTLYDRAKALFNDPNVYGPFLILPACYTLQRILLDKPKRATIAGIAFAILSIGVFVSFSRAAWAHLIASCLGTFLFCFFAVANAKEKVRMLILTLLGALMIVVALGGLLSIPTVQRLFEVRASAQNYDEGETGRFGRQGYAFELALNNPWGIGPMEFRNLKIREEPHDAYVSVLHVYGWGGGLVFYLFIGITIWRGVSFVLRRSANRLLLIPLVSTFIPLCIEAAIIDLDHWRHFYLVGGLIWGVTAAYNKVLPGEDKRLSALV